MSRDILSEGATWLKGMVALHAQQDVTVVDDGTSYQLKASLVDEAGRVLRSEVDLRTEHTKFMFETAAIEAAGFTFKRNTTIVFNDSTYQVVIDNKGFWHYNDTYKTHIVVSAKHVSD